MADHKNPRAGEVWERGGVRREVISAESTHVPSCDRVTYRTGNRTHEAYKLGTWDRWAKKAICIKETNDG